MRADYLIKRRELRGRAAYMPSKSHVQRIMLCNLFSDLPMDLRLGGECEDIGLTARACKSVTEGVPVICGGNATLFRLLLPMLCQAKRAGEFLLSKRLAERIRADLSDFASAFGIEIRSESLGDTVVIKAFRRSREQRIFLRSTRSSQFLSGALMALPLGGKGGSITVEGETVSKGYVDLTVKTMKDFGVNVERTGNEYFVPAGKYDRKSSVYCENDWSLSAVWLTAAALRGNVTVSGCPEDLQPDKAVVGLLEDMGARVLKGNREVNVSSGDIRAFSADVTDVPDLALLLALLAAHAEGESRIYGMERLRLKESDRVKGACALLKSLGAEYCYEGGVLTVKGIRGEDKCHFMSFGDHRVAMACAVASARHEVYLSGADCVGKSCLDFYERFRELGGEYDVVYMGQQDQTHIIR